MEAANDVPASPSKPELGTGTFAPFGSKPYRRLWISATFVWFSIMGQAVARAWLAYELTGTNAALGGVLLAFGVPMLFATPFGGVAADRFSKRLVLQIAMALLTLSAGWIAVALVFDAVAYWMLLASGGLQAIAFALYGPARMAFMSEILGRETLSQGIVLAQMSAEACRVAGPGIAGVVIGSFERGTDAIFLGSTLLGVVAILVAQGLPPAPPRGDGPRRSPLADIADGVRYVRGHAALAVPLVSLLGVLMIAFPYQAFLPTVAEELFDSGSTGFGVLSAASAAGAFLALALLGQRGARGNPWRMLVGTGFALGATVVALAVSPTLLVAIVVLVLIGGTSLAYVTTSQSLLLSTSDMEYHGRIQSLAMLGFSGFGIAALPLGFLADAVGLRETLAGMGAATLVVLAFFTVVSARHRHAQPVDFG